MKITATPIATVPSLRPYPKLMVSGDGRKIVFFLSDTCGFLLVPSGRHEQYYSAFWNVNEFHDYSGTITIQNGDSFQGMSPGGEVMSHRLPEGRTKLLAHDIRHLGLCAICGGIADQRTSIRYEAAYGYKAQDPNAMWHPKCTFAHFGEQFVLDLPKSEQSKFCLSDIPIETMKKLVSSPGGEE